jgi:alkylation response protein AidB-like acyl-CoA dehydrogenase
MDFSLSTEHLMYQTALRKFLEKNATKEYIRKCDKERSFPTKVYEAAVAAGLVGVLIPEEYGGEGGDPIALMLHSEEFGRAGIAGVGAQEMLAYPIMLSGTEAQKKLFLPMLVNGGKISFAVTEPNSGCDTFSLRTTAVLDGDDYILNGQKAFVSQADSSDYMLVMTRTKKDVAKSWQGVTMFIVNSKSPGIEIRRMDMMGMWIISLCEVFFDNVRVPKENVLGKVDESWQTMSGTIAMERTDAAASSLGVAEAAFEDALEYAKERHAFGKPIGQFQVIQHYLVDMYTQVELARNIVYKSAWRNAQGKPSPAESAMAKLVACETAVSVTDKGLRILAGHGLAGSDMQRYFRNARHAIAGGGTSEILKNYIGRTLGLPKSY